MSNTRRQTRIEGTRIWREYLLTQEGKDDNRELTQLERQQRHDAGAILRSLNDCHRGRKCEWCGNPLEAMQADTAKFCTKSCRNQHSRASKKNNQYTDVELAIERTTKILSSCSVLKSSMNDKYSKHVELAEESLLKLLSEVEKLR